MHWVVADHYCIAVKFALKLLGCVLTSSDQNEKTGEPNIIHLIPVSQHAPISDARIHRRSAAQYFPFLHNALYRRPFTALPFSQKISNLLKPHLSKDEGYPQSYQDIEEIGETHCL